MLRYDSAITSVHICRNGVSQAVPTAIFVYLLCMSA